MAAADERLQDLAGRNDSTAGAGLQLQALLEQARQADARQADARRLTYLASVPVMLFFCAVGATVNLTICLSARLIRRPLSPTMCFSVSLAGADAYAAAVLGFGLLVNSLLPIGFQVEPLSDCVLLVLEALRLGGVISTVAHLLALALNHYVGIVRPLHYARLITRGRVTLAVGFLWVVPIAFFLGYFAAAGAFSGQCPHAFLVRATFRRVVATLFFVPLVCMLFTYSHIFMIVRQHQCGALRLRHASQLSKNVKAIVTTLLILGTYVVGWMPGLVVYLLVCADCALQPADVDPRVLLALHIAVNTLIILKCLVDPVIYAARMPEIRLALHRLAARLCCRAGSLSELNVRTQTLRMMSYRYRFSGSTTSSIRRSTLRRNGDVVIPLRVLKASQPASETVEC